MKKAVPSQDCVECAIQRQSSHIGDAPFVLGELLQAHGDHCARRVHAGYPAAVSDQVAGNRYAASAADVKHGGFAGFRREKPIEPSLFMQVIASVTRPGAGVTVIDPDDPVGGGATRGVFAPHRDSGDRASARSTKTASRALVSPPTPKMARK